MAVAGVSEFAFITLVLAQGDANLSAHAGIAVAVDGLMVIVFAGNLDTGEPKRLS